MVDIDDREDFITHFYIMLGLYLALLLGIGIWGFLRSRKKKAMQSSAGDELFDHFVAGREFGVVFLFLSVYSTVWSGYVVVGIPDEAKAAGYFSFRWFPFAVVCCLSTAAFVPLARRINVSRNYLGVYEFVQDRFNSRTLRFWCSVFGFLGSFVFIVIEFKALGDILEAVTTLEVEYADVDADLNVTTAKPGISREFGVLFLCFFIFVCEFLGGMSAIASTDAVQAGVMIVSFLSLYFILASEYGSFSDITGYDCPNSRYTAWSASKWFGMWLGAEDYNTTSDTWSDIIGTAKFRYGCIGHQMSAMGIGYPPTWGANYAPFWGNDESMIGFAGGFDACLDNPAYYSTMCSDVPCSTMTNNTVFGPSPGTFPYTPLNQNKNPKVTHCFDHWIWTGIGIGGCIPGVNPCSTTGLDPCYKMYWEAGSYYAHAQNSSIPMVPLNPTGSNTYLPFMASLQDPSTIGTVAPPNVCTGNPYFALFQFADPLEDWFSCDNCQQMLPFDIPGQQKVDMESAGASPTYFWDLKMFDNDRIRYPATITIFTFTIAGLALPMNPHWIQRYMIAQSDDVYKKAFLVLQTSPWFSFPCVILIGLIASAQFPWATMPMNFDKRYAPKRYAFEIIIGDLAVKGPGYEALCLITICACLAAFMSTADSTVNGCTNVFSVDILQGTLYPNMNPTHVLYASKLCSLICLVIAAVFSFLLPTDNDYSYYILIDLCLGFLWVTIPMWVYGMFGNYVKSRALLMSMFVNVVSLLCIIFIDGTKYHEDSHWFMGNQDVPDGFFTVISAGLWCGILALILAPIFQFFLNMCNNGYETDEHTERPMLWYDDAFVLDRPMLNYKDIKALTVDRKCGIIWEPMGVAMWITAILIIVFTLPWYGEGDRFDMDVTITAGVPAWALMMMMGSLAAALICLAMTFLWNASTDSDIVAYRSEAPKAEMVNPNSNPELQQEV